jgi:hypothetical protein
MLWFEVPTGIEADLGGHVDQVAGSLGLVLAGLLFPVVAVYGWLGRRRTT